MGLAREGGAHELSFEDSDTARNRYRGILNKGFGTQEKKSLRKKDGIYSTQEPPQNIRLAD